MKCKNKKLKHKNKKLKCKNKKLKRKNKKLKHKNKKLKRKNKKLKHKNKKLKCKNKKLKHKNKKLKRKNKKLKRKNKKLKHKNKKLKRKNKKLKHTLDEKSNLPQICLVQICCKYEIRKALQPVQRWRWPNSHKNGQIRPSPHLHWVQSCAKLILATYLHKANLMQIRFFVL